MFGRHVEIPVGAMGRRVLLVDRTAVQSYPDEFGCIEIRLDGLWGPTQRVPSDAVRRLSREEVRNLLRTALGGPGSVAMHDLACRLGVDVYDWRASLERAVDRMLAGSHVAIELKAEALALGRRIGPAAPRQPSQPSPEPSTQAEPQHGTRLHVRIVLDDAAALAGAQVTLTGPDGRIEEVYAGGGGDARLEGLPADGVGRAVVQPRKVPRALPDPATLLHADHILDFTFGTTVAADIPTGGVQTILLRRPELERVDTSDLAFAPDSVLLVPLATQLSPARGLATAMARLQRGPTCRLMIVGHASPDGNANANETLALRRAQGVRHLLVGDRAAWVELAAEHGSPADVQRLLRYLALAHDWPTEPTRVDGIMDVAVKAAVTGFQATYNAFFDREITVDGVVGKQTLGALFDVQQHELRLQLDVIAARDDPPTWFTATGIVSAGARVLGHPAIPGSWSAEGQRRVDLLLLPQGLTWREGHGLEALYDAARLRLLPLSPYSVGPCDFVVQLVDHYGRILAHEPYRVTTDDEHREGTSDDQGMVVERSLQGRAPRLECGESVVIVDERYHQMTRARYARIPAQEPGEDEDDEEDPDAPLPAADDDDADDDDDDDDEDDEDKDDDDDDDDDDANDDGGG